MLSKSTDALRPAFRLGCHRSGCGSSNIKMIQNILILNIRGGVAPTEIGAILLDLKQNGARSMETLIPHDVTPTMLQFRTNQFGEDYVERSAKSKMLSPEYVSTQIGRVNQYIQVADVIVAHNVSNTKRMAEKLVGLSVDHTKPWFDTYSQFPWTVKIKKIANIAKTYGVATLGKTSSLGQCEILLQCIMKVRNFVDIIQTGIIAEQSSLRIVTQDGRDVTAWITRERWEALTKQFSPTSVYNPRIAAAIRMKKQNDDGGYASVFRKS